MKKTFTKPLFILIMMIAILGGQQLSAQVTIGSDEAPHEDALLDLKNKADGTADKGLLLPRVTLTSTTSYAPLTAHVAGMTVYNTATAGDVTPGYYYNDGTKWVRISTDYSQIWKYDGSKIAYLDADPAFVDSVKYFKNGGYRQVLKTLRNISDGSQATSDLTTYPLSLTNSIYNNAYNLNVTYSDLIRGNYTGEPHLFKALNSNLLLIDNQETTTGKRFIVSQNDIFTTAENTANHDLLYGTRNRAIHYGSGKVRNVLGANNEARLHNGLSDHVRGSNNIAVALNSGHTMRVEGSWSVASVRGPAGSTIDVATGQRGLFEAPNSSSDIKSVTVTESRVSTQPTFSGTIKNLFGFRSSIVNDGTLNAENIYGLYVDNIGGASNGNYAIYTNAGKIRFGDLAGTGDRMVFADADGVLKVGDAGSYTNSQIWKYDGSTKAYLAADTAFKDSVSYFKSGGYWKFPKKMRNITTGFVPNIQNNPFVIQDTKYNSSYNLNIAYSDLIRNSASFNEKRLNSHILIVDSVETQANRQFKVTVNEVQTSKNYTPNVNNIIALTNTAHHAGTGKVSTLTGQHSDVTLVNGSAGDIRGSFNQATVICPGTASNVDGTFSFLSLRSGGTVTNAIAARNSARLQDSIKISNLFLNYNYIELPVGYTYKGTVGTVVGTQIYIPTNGSINANDIYGLRIDNIAGAKNPNRNYAIHTGLGKIRFGDLAGAGERMVVADAQGVLKVATTAAKPANSSGTVQTGAAPLNLGVSTDFAPILIKKKSNTAINYAFTVSSGIWQLQFTTAASAAPAATVEYEILWVTNK